MNIFLFIAAVFIGSFFIGKLLERIRVPWIFAALLIGAGLAVKNPFLGITSSETFKLFAQLGMYLLLFLVGFELNVKQLKRKSKFIFGSAFFIISLEGLVGSALVHYLFNYGWITSLAVAFSFATVGEAVLIPILHEFNLVNTKLGQAIIGIGTADDIIEILVLLFVSTFVGVKLESNIPLIFGSLAILILLTLGFRLVGQERDRFKFASIETLFLLILFVFFLFVGVGTYADAAPLGAILAGISVRLFIRDDRLNFVDNELKSMTYGLFAPLFFVWIGTDLSVGYLLRAPLLVFLVVAVSNGLKLLGSFIMGHRELGTKGSVLLGMGLSVRFSTSIIVMKFLYDNKIIGLDIYSVVVASSVVFNFLVPALFSWLAVKWRSAIQQI